ncbi:FeoC-like transcriptional regulator [Azotobacter armeniacus]
MILSEIGQYLRQHGRASLRDLATATGSTPEAVEAMLATLERKGRVRRLSAGSTCGTSCCKCDPATLALYEWIGE